MVASRVQSASWSKLPPGGVRDRWARVNDILVSTIRPRRRASRTLTYLWNFVRIYNYLDSGGGGDHLNDIGLLSNSPRGLQLAQEAWLRLQPVANWSPKHRDDVRTYLAHGLSLTCAAMAPVINPVVYTHRKAATYRCPRSHQTTVSLHEVLPLCVRRLSSNTMEYQITIKVVDEMAQHLQSVSKTHLQAVASFLHRILHDSSPAYNINNPIASLRMRPAAYWVERFASLYSSRPSMAFAQFRRLIRLLSIFHGKVICPNAKVTIPVPRASGGRIPAPSSSTSGATSSSLASTVSEEDEEHRRDRQRLRDLIYQTRSQIAHDDDSNNHHDRVYAFRDDEVKRIVHAADSHLERLVILLLLTTGLRLGGLCRLQWKGSLPAGCPRHATDVPTVLSTVEKGNRVRNITINNTCRMLIARWCVDGRPQILIGEAADRFVFPSSRLPNRCMSTRYAARVCNDVLTRANVHGPHAHPHSFRHTVVQMLHLNGMSFETIARWIGHRNPSTTSGVYGRLAHNDLQATLGKHVSFIQCEDVNLEERWRSIASLLNKPYTFGDHETIATPSPVYRPPAQTKRRQLVHDTLAYAALSNGNNS